MIKPMLAATVKDITTLSFPLIASPKLDGVRCLVKDGVALSRSLKPIPNLYVQQRVARMEGCDGELIVGSPTAADVFNRTVSEVMRKEGKPNVRFHVFDSFLEPQLGWKDRIERVLPLRRPGREVPWHVVWSVEQLLELESAMTEAGYEGVMLRTPEAGYKSGRSTLKEAGLMKLKRFMDSEAVVISVSPLMRNQNKAELNELGYRRRSSRKSGLEATSALGMMTVRDLESGVEFGIGSGFTAEQRTELWREPPIGRVVRYRYQAVGQKSAPRFPVFQGFRHPDDM